MTVPYLRDSPTLQIWSSPSFSSFKEPEIRDQLVEPTKANRFYQKTFYDKCYAVTISGKREVSYGRDFTCSVSVDSSLIGGEFGVDQNILLHCCRVQH